MALLCLIPRKLTLSALPFLFLLHLLLISSSGVVASTSSNADQPSAYAVLVSHGLPAGLLPIGVTGYNLNSSTGLFSVYLGRACHATFKSYDLYYQSTVSGYLSIFSLSRISGVQVRSTVSIDIDSVTNIGEQLRFFLSTHVSIISFSSSPTCRSSFNYLSMLANETNPHPIY